MSKYNLIDIYEQYQIGSGWTTDFDYDGMLMAGLKAGVDTDIEILKKMSDDFEDVNYHRENNHLQNAIEALEDGATKEAAMFFGDFHAEIKQTIKDQGMDIEPTVGQFMASKMEEGEDKEPRDGVKSAASKLGIKPKHVKEVSSREGSRIEGLLSIPLKSKFLEAFQDLYFDLVEEDPFMAEDVVDHLGIEMLKHLDAIQAQGDKLAGVNTDADFEREQRAQLDMREEESINEELAPTGIAISQKQLDDLEKLGAISGLEVIVQDKDGSNVRKVDYTLTNTNFEKGDDDYDYLEEGLKEHFGRFMKDYQ
jgi:hypothetical protein